MVSQSDITYRLGGIPDHYGNDEVSQLVAQLLGLDVGAIWVRSLASHPFREREKVATLNLRERAWELENGTNEWTFHYTNPNSGEALDIVLDTNFIGITPLHGTPDERCDACCIALSGLNAHAFGSFKARSDSFMWLRDALPMDLPGSRMYIYGYDTSMVDSLSRQTILDLGLYFAENLKALVGGSSSAPPKSLLLIGHSLGGLVLEQGQPNEGLISCLRMDSDFLELQQEDFATARSKMRNAQVIAFYETVDTPTVERDRESQKWMMTGSPALLVSKSSATMGCDATIPINRNHSEIVKFPRQHNEYFVVVNRLRELRKLRCAR
ncbi:Protein serac1 [Lasiodiplodia theobromae]|uniref:Protein serac1 n=1 Tax=Lasiodiplodia theobromae TaxID=45133 RepID=UPI0015C35A6F|nr:Protein serac1 [Lasiodiplodia theobromae]KAF4546210.1 Protein serac1 [Lasiodiplodia theobromae]